jgi:hypothetical protein
LLHRQQGGARGGPRRSLVQAALGANLANTEPQKTEALRQQVVTDQDRAKAEVKPAKAKTMKAA